MPEPAQNPKIMMMMLESREIILTEVETHDGYVVTTAGQGYKFITPALVTVSRGAHGSLGFMLTSWLPHEIMKDTRVEFLKSKIIGRLTPHPALISFYQAWAETERDKLVSFEKDFVVQIKEIEKYHTEKYARTKEAHDQVISTLPSDLSNAVLELFEANTGWGDPSVTQ